MPYVYTKQFSSNKIKFDVTVKNIKFPVKVEFYKTYEGNNGGSININSRQLNKYVYCMVNGKFIEPSKEELSKGPSDEREVANEALRQLNRKCHTNYKFTEDDEGIYCFE